jgi:hypothetical protein
VAYFYAGWKFAFHFLDKGLQEIDQLGQMLAGNSEATSLLSRVKSTVAGSDDFNNYYFLIQKPQSK